jgi:basic amino acid/polyamine antiporter, APA family
VSAKDQQKAGTLGLTSATGPECSRCRLLASAGTISLVVLAVIAVGAMVLAVLFGQLTRRIPNSDGGLYAYARHEFGDFAGYLTGDAMSTCRCYSSPWWAGSLSPRLTSVRSTPRAAACARRPGSPPG